MRLIDYHNENENDKEKSNTLIPQSCLYFQGFWGSKLFTGCLVVWPSNPYLRGM